MSMITIRKNKFIQFYENCYEFVSFEITSVVLTLLLVPLLLLTIPTLMSLSCGNEVPIFLKQGLIIFSSLTVLFFSYNLINAMFFYNKGKTLFETIIIEDVDTNELGNILYLIGKDFTYNRFRNTIQCEGYDTNKKISDIYKYDGFLFLNSKTINEYIELKEKTKSLNKEKQSFKKFSLNDLDI